MQKTLITTKKAVQNLNHFKHVQGTKQFNCQLPAANHYTSSHHAYAHNLAACLLATRLPMAPEIVLTSGSSITVPSVAALEVHKAQWCCSKLDKAQIHEEGRRFDGKHLPFRKCPAN